MHHERAVPYVKDIKQVVRHTLRHTAITHLVQAGVDLPTVKRISGHKNWFCRSKIQFE